MNTVKHKPDYPEDFCYVDCLMIVQNMTEYPLYLSEEWGSGGYKNVALDIRKKDGKVFVLKKHKGIWDRNFPSMLIVPPHSMLAYPLSLDAGIWDGLPQIEIGEEIWMRARLWMGYTKINGEMVRVAQKPIESCWTAVIIKARRLAHVSEVNQCN